MSAEHDSVGWLTYAGTALSALGAILNGTNSLYGLSHQLPWHDSAGNGSHHLAVASGVALSSGWMAAMKIGTASTGLSLSTVSLGAGCMYASVGFLYFLWSIVRISTVRPPRHAPEAGSPEAEQYPSPEWLSTRVLNWGVMGRVGVGKSTLINALRGLHARNPEAAPVGVGHTTRRPRPYSFAGDVARLTRNMARLWDLPGAGTKDWPSVSYIRDAGLRHFDGVLFVISGAFSEAEAELVNQLIDFKVPYYLVRNKCDQDVVNNAQDNNAGVEDTLEEIRVELTDYGADRERTFLISAKHPDCTSFDFGHLLRTMATDVAGQRGELPEFDCEVLLPFKKAIALADTWEPQESRKDTLAKLSSMPVPVPPPQLHLPLGAPDVQPVSSCWDSRTADLVASSSAESPPLPSFLSAPSTSSNCGNPPGSFGGCRDHGPSSPRRRDEESTGKENCLVQPGCHGYLPTDRAGSDDLPTRWFAPTPEGRKELRPDSLTPPSLCSRSATCFRGLAIEGSTLAPAAPDAVAVDLAFTTFAGKPAFSGESAEKSNFSDGLD